MKVSFTHLIGYAIAQAWKDHPTMGHSFRQDNGKPQRVVPPHINLGLAVDVQRKDGSRTLIVPVIKQADTLDFAGFREVYEDLIRRRATARCRPTTCRARRSRSPTRAASAPSHRCRG